VHVTVNTGNPEMSMSGGVGMGDSAPPAPAMPILKKFHSTAIVIIANINDVVTATTRAVGALCIEESLAARNRPRGRGSCPLADTAG
jgi:hypothetical protein